jgi:putative ABC transport system ATP-binding protein
LSALILERVSKSLGGRRLLDAITMSIEPGQIVALLGESGTGKSTLLNLIAALEPVDSGRIVFDGVDLTGLGPDAAARFRMKRLGFVFQAFHLLPYLNAERNVAVPLLLAGAAPATALKAAREMLERVGLAPRAGALPRELSGGEQQRVALARALVHQPRLVLADEPTGNLDPVTAEAVLAQIAGQVRASGATLLMATHSEQAAAIADRRWKLDVSGLSELAADRAQASQPPGQATKRGSNARPPA